MEHATAGALPSFGDDKHGIATAPSPLQAYDAFTTSKTVNLAGPLKVAGIPYKNPHLGSKGFGMGGSAA